LNNMRALATPPKEEVLARPELKEIYYGFSDKDAKAHDVQAFYFVRMVWDDGKSDPTTYRLGFGIKDGDTPQDIIKQLDSLEHSALLNATYLWKFGTADLSALQDKVGSKEYERLQDEAFGYDEVAS
jgi:hypothetical protein